MNTQTVQKIVQDFVGQLQAAFHAETIAKLTGNAPAAKAPRAKAAKAAKGSGSNGHSNGATTASNGDSGKRTAEEIDALIAKFVEYVKDYPGQRMEQINQELGTTTKELQLPIRKAIADKVIRTKGNKRATIYYVNEK